MTRDMIQGYIEGYLSQNGDPAELKNSIKDWMLNHPFYPQDERTVQLIGEDLESYRGVPKAS